jgi:hypothetical protein
MKNVGIRIRDENISDSDPGSRMKKCLDPNPGSVKCSNPDLGSGIKKCSDPDPGSGMKNVLIRIRDQKNVKIRIWDPG